MRFEPNGVKSIAILFRLISSSDQGHTEGEDERQVGKRKAGWGQGVALGQKRGEPYQEQGRGGVDFPKR